MSDEAPAAEESTSVETTIPNQTHEAPATAPEFQTIVPEEYADKAWVKDVKDIDGFFKMADDMKSEMGRRAEAAPKAPESVDGYELGEPINPEFQDAVKEMFLKNGVPADMAKGLDESWNEIVSKFAPNQEEADADFHKRTEELFGARADEAVETAKKLLSAHTPETMAEDVNGLGNKELTIMAAVLDSIQAKYINEDDIPKGDGAGSGVMSNEEKRAEAKKLLATPEWKSKSHPGHDAVAIKIDNLYKGIT